MNFALNQMKAMGWTEGKGLGLSEDGITKAIKPNAQLDTRGLGFTIEDSIQLNNQWWNDAYNAAKSGLKSECKITSIGVVVKSKREDESSSKNKKIYNNHFISAGMLSKDTEADVDAVDDDFEPVTKDETIEHEKKKRKKGKKKRSDKNDQEDEPLAQSTSNESVKQNKKSLIDFNQVYAKSDGRTCHKAARLGIKMNGKMKRIEEQEREFIKKMKCS